MQLSDAATGAGEAVQGDGIIGVDPNSSEPVYLKSGRFGPYVQLGDGEDPKRASLPKGWNPERLSIEQALQLLSLPRTVGNHPETGLPITSGIGRYGPFVLHDGKYANLPDVEEVFSVGLNRAVDLLAQKAAGGSKRAGGTQSAIKTFEHEGGTISIRDGRYGPYVNQGKVNATLPKNVVPVEVTLEQALELIQARAEATGTKTKKAPAKKTAKASPLAKGAATKKVAVKAE
jgi:DNA topoisomerase-1